MFNGMPMTEVTEQACNKGSIFAFEIEGDVIRALYVVRNPDKLRHLATTPHERGPG
jgi:hypothetical protein